MPSSSATSITRAQASRALAALTQIGEKGARTYDVVKKLARLQAVLIESEDVLSKSRASLLRAHAKRDDDGDVIALPNGNVALKNQTMFDLEIEQMLSERVEIPDELFLTESDLRALTELPSPNVLAVLWPVKADEDAATAPPSS